MKLIVDASFREIRLSLFDGSQELISHTLVGAKAEIFPDLLRESLAQLKRPLSDIHEVIAHTGPGSFTGVRTVLSFAQALCIHGNRVLKSVGTLESMAKCLAKDTLVLVQANPDAYYACLYNTQSGMVEHQMLPLQAIESYSHLNWIAPASLSAIYTQTPIMDLESFKIHWFSQVAQISDTLPTIQALDLKVLYVQASAAERHLKTL